MNALSVKLLLARFPGLSYDDAFQLAESAASTLEQLPATDPAWVYFHKEMTDMYKYCEAISRDQDLRRTDHLASLQVIYSYDRGAVTEVAVAFINKAIHPRDHLSHVKQLLQEKLVTADVGWDRYKDLEVVPA